MFVQDKFKQKLLIYALSILCIFLVVATERTAIISYAYTLFVFFVINYFCEKKHRTRNILYFHFYLLLAIIVFLIQKDQIPSFMGLSGPEGFGTDDGTYYAGVTDAPIKYEARLDIAEEMGYCDLIRFLYPFKIEGPLSVVIFNLLGISFLPYLTSRIAYIIFKDIAIAWRSEWLILFCPFVMSLGLIIMRDVICTTILAAAFLSYITKRYLGVFLFAGLLGYLKFGFLPLLLVPILAHYIILGEGKKLSGTFYLKLFSVIVVLLIGGVYLLPYVSTITGGKLESGFFRMSFVEYLLAYNDDSVIAKIYKYPLVLRIPMLIAAFLIIPTLNLGFIAKGIFNVRFFLMAFLAPIYWWFSYRSFFNFFLSYKRLSSEGKVLLYSLLLMALVLGVVSLQARHRVTMMPFFYIAVAYTDVMLKKYNKFMSASMLFLFIVAQVVFVL